MAEDGELLLVSRRLQGDGAPQAAQHLADALGAAVGCAGTATCTEAFIELTIVHTASEHWFVHSPAMYQMQSGNHSRGVSIPVFKPSRFGNQRAGTP